MSDPADVLDKLIDEVAECLEGFGQYKPSVYTYDDRDGPPEDITWYVDISPAVEEIVGGRHDGAEGFPGFSACVSSLMTLLEPPAAVPEAGIPAMPAPHVEFICEVHEPAHIALEGRYKGLNVILQIFSEPVDDDEDEDEDELDEDDE